MTLSQLPRCHWVKNDPLCLAYHDQEWGQPCFNEQLLFEALCLETQQAGLSWLTVLKKRAAYRQIFHHFQALEIVRISEAEFANICSNPALIRNPRKLRAIIDNAHAYLKFVEQHTLKDFLWQLLDNTPLIHYRHSHKEVPNHTPLSTYIAQVLKSFGFVGLGPTSVYAFMQAVGLVNDHLASCHLSPYYKEFAEYARPLHKHKQCACQKQPK